MVNASVKNSFNSVFIALKITQVYQIYFKSRNKYFRISAHWHAHQILNILFRNAQVGAKPFGFDQA